MSYANVGKAWTPESFARHLRTVDLSWAKGITLHHTAAPSLAQRPHGLTVQHIENIASFYKRLGWSRGPHLFIDDDQIFGMTPLSRSGIHAVSFNRTHIGVEVLGNYDSESPSEGRGQACWTTAALATRALLDRAGLSVSTVNGHRDDPKTSKTCPGKLVDLTKFRDAVAKIRLSADRSNEDRDAGPSPAFLQMIASLEWQLDKLKEEEEPEPSILDAMAWQITKLRKLAVPA